MAARKPLDPRAEMAKRAIAAFSHLLSDPEVRKALVRAPSSVLAWARQATADLRESNVGERLNPVKRFGQAGLERRVAALRLNLEQIFPKGDEPGRAELLEAVDHLRVATDVAGRMPLIKRKRVHLRIDRELDSMEAALIEAVLPRGVADGEPS